MNISSKKILAILWVAIITMIGFCGNVVAQEPAQEVLPQQIETPSTGSTESLTDHSRATKFTAQVYVLTKDEGGRHTPFFNNYRPQFYFRTTDVTGVISLPEGTEMCMPGDNVEMTVELIHPIAMDQGLTFAIREGGRTVGSGRVATIIE